MAEICGTFGLPDGRRLRGANTTAIRLDFRGEPCRDRAYPIEVS